jgi:uncharacterized membrane protein
MSFLILIVTASVLAYIPQYFFGDRRDLRQAMRHGLALGLLFTGTDHFVNATSRYVPMVPDLLGPLALPLVHVSGMAEIAGALGLLVPVTAYRRLRLPNLQHAAGIGLAVLFALLVVANINVAMKGSHVEGLDFGRGYYLLRPFLQPLFIAWALYCVGIPGRIAPRIRQVLSR